MAVVQSSHDALDAASAASADHEVLDERALSKLRWRCRRGMLENDLLIERFFSRHATQLTVRHANALAELMQLDDNDLLDLLLARKTLAALRPAMHERADLHEVLTMLKRKP